MLVTFLQTCNFLFIDLQLARCQPSGKWDIKVKRGWGGRDIFLKLYLRGQNIQTRVFIALLWHQTAGGGDAICLNVDV